MMCSGKYWIILLEIMNPASTPNPTASNIGRPAKLSLTTSDIASMTVPSDAKY